MADAETAYEYNSAIDMALNIAAKDAVPHFRAKRRYDPELGLNLAFYNRAVVDERKSKLGYHYMLDDSKKPLLESNGTPRVIDCDCEEEWQIRVANKMGSTLARVVKERMAAGVHQTPGRPIFADKIYIRIMVPGEQRNEVDTEAIIIGDEEIPNTHEALPEAAHNLKYPRAWADYKRRQNKSLEAAAVIGTPLRELAKESVGILKPSQVAGFEAAGIRTVEQLLATSDGNGQHFMGWASIKRSVQDWSDQAAARAPSVLMEEVEKRAAQREAIQKAQIEALQEQVKQLSARQGIAPADYQSVVIAANAAPLEKVKRGPGRPRKLPILDATGQPATK